MACNVLNLDARTPKIPGMKIEDGEEEVVLDPSQVIGIFVLYLCERYGNHGLLVKIVADFNGSGKTLIILGFLIMIHQRDVSLVKLGQLLRLTPSILIVPVTIVGKTVNELQARCGKSINVVHDYAGTRSNENAITQKDFAADGILEELYKFIVQEMYTELQG